jgi:hypothetical protein
VTLSVSKALECLLLVVTPHVFPQEQMSMVLKTVDHLNQAKAEATENERCAMKTETGVLGSANEEGANSSSIQKRVIIPRRSKRVPKGPCLGLAEDPIQDNSLECHEEKDCELPVHTTDTFPQRKRKSYAASSDAITTPKSRKKIKADKDNQPNLTQVLTNGAINSLDLKMSLDIAIFLTGTMQTIQDWDIGVTA